MPALQKRAPGLVRDAIISVLSDANSALTVAEISRNVDILLGPTPTSSIRSYLRLNTPELFENSRRGVYRVRVDELDVADTVEEKQEPEPSLQAPLTFGKVTLFHSDCFSWLKQQPKNSIHAVVTDPPYGLEEYSAEQVQKLRSGKGGIWRIPPSFDGNKRSPLPRFTVLTEKQLDDLSTFFYDFGMNLFPVLVPGGNVVVAANPLLSYLVSNSLSNAGLERRGEIVRLTMTMRGGDRPKNAHKEFKDVSVMPRSMWEPWLVFRKPLEGRVQDNLKKWKTGGFRRISDSKPFGDVIASSPTRKNEREIAPHPSLKPQAFLRQIVRGVLPLGTGIVLDPFAGSGSTLAAAEAIGYTSIGVERDEKYFEMGKTAIPKLSELKLSA